MMTDIESRALAKTIVMDNGAARVKFGRTNGQIVLHVRDGRRSFTLKSDADWQDCPLNSRRRF